MSDEFLDDISPYDRKLSGVQGEFGEGAGARVRFLQTVLQPPELRTVSLVSSIPGSEAWSVANLFQRNVDIERVTNGIIPYLENPRQIKFFNPLTLVVLPMSDNGRQVQKELPVLEHTKAEEQSIDEWYTHSDYYRMGVRRQFAVLEWNSKRCHLVAIDGQHRLSAMQRVLSSASPNVDITDWRVPVVVLVIEQLDSGTAVANLLDLVRNTFMYINTAAVRVNPAREILLNDEVPSTVCTQEFVDSLHINDTKPLDERDRKKIPLLLLDWRGDTNHGKRVNSPAALKTVEEIHAWLKQYIIGDDYSNRQRTELAVDDLIPPISGFSDKAPLSAVQTAQVRYQFRTLVLPGLELFLQEFAPYAAYIDQVRHIEEESLRQSDLSRHAFMKLRFGAHNASDDLIEDVNAAYADLVDEITGAKESLPSLLKLDIGMRGVMYAFARLCTSLTEHRLAHNGQRPTWEEVARKVLPAANSTVEDGWLSVEDRNSTGGAKNELYEFLHLVVFDASGSITNYRIQDAEGALGSLLALIMAVKMRDDSGDLSSEAVVDLWNDESVSLAKTIEKEARKLHRSQLSTTFEGTQPEFKAKVNEEARKTRDKYLARLKKHLSIQ